MLLYLLKAQACSIKLSSYESKIMARFTKILQRL